MLSAPELQAIREDLADLLWETCTIRRRTNPTGPFADVAGGAPIPCRLTLIGSAVRAPLPVAASEVDANAVLSLPAGTDVAAGDRILVDGRVFEASFVVPRVFALQRVLGSVER